ncbi:MAG: 50S ribosomal protein L25 [Myxococcota bacterium]
MAIQSELTATSRDDHGKGPSRRLRRTGSIPAVLYSQGKEARVLSVEPKALGKALATPLGTNTLISLTVNGNGKSSKHHVLVKDMQRDPVRRELVHADFMEVDVTKPVRVFLPVVLVGKNKSIGAGGVVEQVSRKLRVFANAQAIPEKIEVDISELKMGQSIHARELKLPEGVKPIGDGKETIATVVAVREEKAAAAAAPVEGAAAAAPAAGAAAAGAKPAAGAAGGAAPAKGAAPAAGGEKKK